MRFIKFSLILLFSTLFFNTVTAQSTFGTLLPQDPSNGPECKTCINAFRKKPKEVRFTVKSDEQHNLFFEVTHKEWLDVLFKSNKDGLLIDIVSKEKYNCSTTIEHSENGIQGTSLSPIFSKKIKSGLKKQSNGRFRVKVGSIPENLRGQELEFNIFFICLLYTSPSPRDS